MDRHAVMSNDFDMSEAGDLVQELKVLMRLNFIRVSVVHNPRDYKVLERECEVGTNPILDVKKSFVPLAVTNHLKLAA
jgi:hypothetical protein